MSQDRHHRLAITALSPVHMGTDADYEPTGYVIDDGALFEFDGIAALAALPANERTKLDQILSGRPSDRMLREVQSFFFDNRESLIACSRRQVRVSENVEKFYEARIGQVAQHEQGGRKVQNKLEIERTAWNPVSGQPILPGSGLKGAIRTALLDRENAGSKLRNDRERNRQLQERLFQGAFATDPMRLIRLGDAPLHEGVELPTKVYFALNRKKHPVRKDGSLVQSQAEQRNLYQLLECLPPLHPRAFSGSLAVQDLGRVGNERNTPKLRFAAGTVAAACNAFYRPVLDSEMQLLRERGYIDDRWSEQITALLKRLKPALDADSAFLLRVGRHSGAESVTLNGARSIRIMQGKGQRAEYLSSAKTLWLASHERQAQRNLLPFGWLLVEIAPGDDGPWPQMTQPANDRDWFHKVRKRVEALAGTAAKVRAEQQERQQRREAEAAARKAAEEAERKRIEEEKHRKQQEFDALPESEKRLLRLQNDIDAIGASGPLNKDQFGGFKGLVSALIEETATWSPAERQRTADVVHAAFERLGWAPSGLKPDKRKKQEKKNRDLLEKLRG